MRKTLPLIIVICAIQFSNSQYEGYSPDSWNNQVKTEEIFLSLIHI